MTRFPELVFSFVGFLDCRLLRSCRPERQRVPTTDPEDPECEDDVKKPGNDGAGAPESAENGEELKTQNNRNSEGAQNSAQKEEEPKIQKNGNVEGAPESAENGEELKTQNNRNSEGPQNSAQKEEPKIQNNKYVEEAQDSEKEDETSTSKL
ncbi:uncharacterized protein LOC143814910 isoform X2 [Ranitomeya variabilis]|uniref:uncharacterized protein LOC143814910 isoform X2 n=1 Tax=Ranitomeya variabilis TaxID=490064 RepID=UPI0040578A71